MARAAAWRLAALAGQALTLAVVTNEKGRTTTTARPVLVAHVSNSGQAQTRAEVSSNECGG